MMIIHFTKAFTSLLVGHQLGHPQELAGTGALREAGQPLIRLQGGRIEDGERGREGGL